MCQWWALGLAMSILQFLLTELLSFIKTNSCYYYNLQKCITMLLYVFRGYYTSATLHQRHTYSNRTSFMTSHLIQAIRVYSVGVRWMHSSYGLCGKHVATMDLRNSSTVPWRLQGKTVLCCISLYR